MNDIPEMVERVARALSGYTVHGESGIPNADRPMSTYEIGLASAAIEAMREPTDRMLRASPLIGTGPDELGNWATNTRPAQAVWPAMIDAALTL